MKWTMILLNLAAAAGVIVGGAMASTSIAAYSEFKHHGIFDPANHKSSGGESVDVAESMKDIGKLGATLPPLTYAAAAIFILNAVAFAVLGKKKPGGSKPSA
jgi:hypothetical protein